MFLRVVLERKKESILCLWNLLRYHMKENKDKKIEEKKLSLWKEKRKEKKKTLYRRKIDQIEKKKERNEKKPQISGSLIHRWKTIMR